MTNSPYKGVDEADWPKVTNKLVAGFPLQPMQLIEVVNQAWNDIYASSFGDTDLKIGESIFLPAQATGVIMEKLIAVRLEQLDPLWRGGITKTEKDIVRTDDDHFSFEIKTSSSKSGLYGNRSTGHRSDNRTKVRAGYYLVVNYKLPKEDDTDRFIQKIRFGWIDDEDWVGQAKPTGQQASIGAKLARLKLQTLYAHG
jgi:hypothetical protein